MSVTFRPDLRSRRAMLAAIKGLVFAGPPITWDRQTVATAFGATAFCLDPPGRDVLATPQEVLALVCAECKKLAILGARWLIDTGQATRVEVCMTVDPHLDQEHVFLRVNGDTIRDFAQEAGMPPRQVGPFLAELVWAAQ